MNPLWASLSIRHRLSIAAVALLVGAGLWAFVHWRRESDFRPLFTGLSEADAGAMVQRLKETGVAYRLAENGTVLVPSDRRAELRLGMAAAGLPKSGRIGFELFDKTNFGATEFAEHVNYRRALEGELERSIMSLAEVEHARVHLTFPKESVFLEAQQPAKASVLLQFRAGATLGPPHVLAVSYLVASAVEGLSPEAVSIVDMRGNLLNRARKAGAIDGPEPSEAVLEYRHRIEADLLAKINATLEPLLGADRFRAGVSVECDFSGGEQSEETFDPARSVMLTSQKTEDISGSGGSNGVPGTASNLPRPTSRPGAALAGLSRRTENVSYQTSRTVRRVTLPRGELKKMSLAVLVDQQVEWQQQGAQKRRVLVPPPPEKLKVIRDLVAGVTGLTPQRGDQLVVETLPFESTLNLEPPVPNVPASGPAPRAPVSLPKLGGKTLLIAGAIGLGTLVLLGAGIVFLQRRNKRAGREQPGMAAELPPGQSARLARGSATSSVEDSVSSQLAERQALRDRQTTEALSMLKVAPIITKKSEVLTKHLRENLKKDADISLHILRSWLKNEGS